jgi:hypothetical protein
MADDAAPETMTPEQFFEQLLPAGFAAQKESGASVPQDFTMQYHVAGDGGGDWHVTIKDGIMTTKRGADEAALTFRLALGDFLDAVLSRNGAAPSILLPASRPGRPDNSGRAKMLKGTISQELSREAGEPFVLEMTFNGAAAPRTVLKMKLVDFVAMQEGRLNGQEAFMTGRLRIEGDMAFMMQVAALTT